MDSIHYIVSLLKLSEGMERSGQLIDLRRSVSVAKHWADDSNNERGRCVNQVEMCITYALSNVKIRRSWQ